MVMADTFGDDISGRAEDSFSALDGYTDVLLGGSVQFSARDLATYAQVSVEQAEDFWASMGFPVTDPDEVAYTLRDAHAIKRWAAAMHNGHIDQATARSLVRAHSHLADRLALWQVEALVEDTVRRHGLDDTSARTYVLENMKIGVPMLEEAFNHAWQRQLHALLARMEKEVSQRSGSDTPKRFPLTRSLGFVDMVSYTSTSTILGDRLPALIDRFEDVTRGAVTRAGGRVVKMIGDAVLFIADELGTGLEVVTTLIDQLQADDEVLPVRASFVRGDVFSRSGDVFGPTVNLASRLAGIAPEGGILTDASTAAAITAGHGGAGYSVESFPKAELRGVGRVQPFLISRDFSQ